MISSRPLLAFSPAPVGVLALTLLDPSFTEIKNFAPTIVLVFLILWAVIKLAPTWKEVKMREMDIREKEVAQREQQAIAIQTLAEVTQTIAVEQRHATEALRIGERVTMARAERLSEATQEVTSRLDSLESRVTAQAA